MNIQRWPSRSSARYSRPNGSSWILNAVDHPWDARPARRRLALLAMVFRALIVRRRGGEHDQPLPRLQLGMADGAVLIGVALIGLLSKAERPLQPGDGGRRVLVREHRYDCCAALL